MLARLFALLPFSLSVPEGGQFPIYEYVDEGYSVRVYPPRRSDRPRPLEGVDEIRMDGVPAFQADVLQIDFHKEAFDRSKGRLCDPPEQVIRRAVNSFLLRLRHVARAPQIRPLNFPWISWRIRYLNDDETELDKDENLVRGRGTLQFSLIWIALNKKVWEDVHSLPVDFEPPAWEGLLLDAQEELPAIGPAIVLAATSLEVFISYVLDGMADIKAVTPELWRWIRQRGDWLREPTVEEQYDTLLKVLTGHTLKEDQKLWESFKHLKTARNAFVHEGVAKVGSAPVTLESAQKLIASASEIVARVRSWIPSELHWPEFRHAIQMEAFKKLT